MDEPLLRSRARPSRIYAGNEPLPDVNRAVPIALCFVAFGAWRVRALFAEWAASPGPRWDWQGKDTFPTGWLDKGDLESAMVWLVVGFVACLLAIGYRWWRGREEWGDVPLAYGVGLCAIDYLIASWPSFDRHGQVVSMPFFEPGFGLAFALALVLGYLGYMVWELATRPWRDRRVLLVGVVVVLGCTTWFSVRHGRALRESYQPSLEDGSRLTLVLPRLRYSGDAPDIPFGAGCGGVVYYERGDRLWLSSADCSGPRYRLIDSIPIARHSESTEPDRDLERLNRIRDRHAEKWNKNIGVMLDRDATAADLLLVAEDARSRFPEAWFLVVLGAQDAERVRGASLGPSNPTGPDAVGTLLKLDVHPREPFLKMHGLGDPDFERALSAWRSSAERVVEPGQKRRVLQVRLQVDPDLSVEDLNGSPWDEWAYGIGTWMLEPAPR